MSANWGYDANNGPNTWAKNWPAAGFGKQSPINIDTTKTKYEESLGPLQYKYVEGNVKKISNCGTGCRVDLDGEGSLLTGGPLREKFQLEQFHWHWGPNDSEGSEHTVNGKMTAAELHFVHWNKDLCKTFGEAVTTENGLAVLGVFMKVGQKNAAFQKLVDGIQKIKRNGQDTEIPGGFDIKSLLPKDTRKYWSYNGSLTTPPCYESVNWIVLAEPIEISVDQINAFRALSCDSKGDKTIIKNYRPPQELHGRIVKASFPTSS